MRQSGILAAAALHGLEHHRQLLIEDHRRARGFANIVDGAGGARVVSPDTNIVMVDLPEGLSSSDVVSRSLDRGVRITPWSLTRIRAVTHLDADDAAVERAATVVAEVLHDCARASRV